MTSFSPLRSTTLDILILQDLSGAFDTTDHSILLSRLESSLHLSGTALSWFKSYLSNRQQFIIINISESDTVPVPQGVPQGSQLTSCSDMEDSLGYTPGLSSDHDLWKNQSFLSNKTDGSVFKPMLSPVMNNIINMLLIIGLFITMVSLGCTMEVSKIKRHIMKPKGLAIAVLAQYGIMPLVAFSLVKLLQQTDMRAVVVLICGCCPGGTLSNILALAVQGDMNLSILMTACSTLMAFGMMPLLLSIYCRGFNLQNTMPFLEITISLVMILIPCGIGVAINYYKPQYAKIVTRVGLSLMLIVVLGIVVVCAAGSGVFILTVLSAPLMICSAVMPIIGFSFGYVLSWVVRLDPSERRTVAMETGCQNTQLCATIMKLAFPMELVGALFLFPMLYALFQVTEGALLAVLYSAYQRFTRRAKDKYQPAIAEEHEAEDKSV
ncbi:hepatic sodium/bile acid cotransporter [Pseudoliparis swirei]|uniref:hepatic sodium/bile acid cotransporter n=1 Tax=Pseudoliparis swirei TaxID=2059687 RepID=UPI0024BE1A82|nr:hepatic sodium/bile acid cotransporter [Pseudoliparis swirei]